MDCNVTTNFLAEWYRMCIGYKTYTQIETECKMHHACRMCVNCKKWVTGNPEAAIEIVQEWSDAHQPKTRLSEFLEKYPKTKLYGASELPRFCVADLYGTTCEDMGMVGVGCADCWNTPVDEQGVQ